MEELTGNASPSISSTSSGDIGMFGITVLIIGGFILLGSSLGNSIKAQRQYNESCYQADFNAAKEQLESLARELTPTMKQTLKLLSTFPELGSSL